MGSSPLIRKHFEVPPVLQKHILSLCFVAPPQLAVVTKHFLSRRVMFSSAQPTAQGHHRENLLDPEKHSRTERPVSPGARKTVAERV